MLVRRQDVANVIERLSLETSLGLDTETTGLLEDDSLFSLIIAGANETFYFNFNEYSDIDPDCVLPRADTFSSLQSLFRDEGKVWFIHNAKFDQRMLAKEGCLISGTIHCTYAIERVLRNNYFGKDAYSLDACAKRRGWQKDEAVKEYISKNKLYTKKTMPGKKKVIQHPHFDKVPHQVMIPYGIKDGHLHRTLGLAQIMEGLEIEEHVPRGFPSTLPVLKNEQRFTKTAFRMERKGVMIDKPYVAKALEYEMSEINKAEKEFLEFTGEPFMDSNKPLAAVFDKLGEAYPKTEKGNPSFTADVLEEMTTPVASIVNRIRYHDKRAGTYYSSFLYYADALDVIHADCRQAGTETGRCSYRDPNLQNVPKEDEEEDQKIPYHVRSSFIPRPGHFFYSVDYRQQEFRMMLDYAGEHELIRDINAGADVHEATARLCGITRRQAKTINFGLLYGMGIDKLARSLGISLEEARALRELYFAKLPKVRAFIRSVIKAGEARGYIFNWAGRRNYISQRDWAYILPNHLIQGGCADVIKFAMNEIDDMLIERKSPSSMLLQVHDELLIETPFGDERIIEPIRTIMEKVYKPQNGMRLDTAVEYSLKSWGFRDKIKGTPYEANAS